MAKPQVEPYIQVQAQELPEAERNKLIEVVESELLSLHDGNFARYLVRPSEFKKWQEKWKH